MAWHPGSDDFLASFVSGLHFVFVLSAHDCFPTTTFCFSIHSLPLSHFKQLSRTPFQHPQLFARTSIELPASFVLFQTNNRPSICSPSPQLPLRCLLASLLRRPLATPPSTQAQYRLRREVCNLISQSHLHMKNNTDKLQLNGAMPKSTPAALFAAVTTTPTLATRYAQFLSVPKTALGTDHILMVHFPEHLELHLHLPIERFRTRSPVLHSNNAILHLPADLRRLHSCQPKQPGWPESLHPKPQQQLWYH